MGSDSISSKGYKQAKTGLGLISFGLSLSIILAIVVFIVYLIKKEIPSTMQKVDLIVLLVAKASVFIGLILCFFSGQKNFSFALLMYLSMIILLIVIAALKKEPTDWIYAVYYSLLALGHLSIILGLKNLASGRKAFNTFVISLCLLLFLGIIVLVILGSCNVVKGDWLIPTIRIMNMLESIFFLLALLTTYKALK